MTLPDIARTALRGLQTNKLRAGLSTLGILVGIASIIAMLALGNGARVAVEQSFRFLGSDNMALAAKHEFDDGELVPVGEILSYQDGLDMPREVEMVDRVQMSVEGLARVRNTRTGLNMVIKGSTADALDTIVSDPNIQPLNWLKGAQLTAADLIGSGRF